MIAAIIPARAGSKRLPGKNLARIGGSTLVELAIRCAQEVDEIDIIAVSTDCPDIAAEAFRCGALVIPRPADLATDDATSESVALHAAKALTLNGTDDIVLLQPTSPLRTARDVRLCLHLWSSYRPRQIATVTDNGHPNGAIYVACCDSIASGGEFADYDIDVEMPADRSIDIDTPEDLAKAQEWWARRAVA